MTDTPDQLNDVSTEQLLAELVKRGGSPASGADVPPPEPPPVAVPAVVDVVDQEPAPVAPPEPAPEPEPVVPVPAGPSLPPEMQPDAQAQPVPTHRFVDGEAVPVDQTPHVVTGAVCPVCGRNETELTQPAQEGPFVHLCKLCGTILDTLHAPSVEAALGELVRRLTAQQPADQPAGTGEGVS